MKGISFASEKADGRRISTQFSTLAGKSAPLSGQFVAIVARITADDGRRVKIASGVTVPVEYWQHGSVTVPGNRGAHYQGRKAAHDKFELFKKRCEVALTLITDRAADTIRHNINALADLDAAALDALTADTLQAHVEQHDAALAVNDTVGDYLRDYAAHGTSTRDKTHRKSLSDATKARVNTLAAAWDRYETAAGRHVNLARISAADVQAFQSFIADEDKNTTGRAYNGTKRSNNSIAAMMGTLRTAINYICKAKGVALAPGLFDDTARQEYADAALPYLNDDDLAALIAHETDGRMNEVQRAFIFSCMTGCRFKDLAALTPANIDADDMMLRYQASKTSAVVSVPLNDKALAALGDDWQHRRRLFNVPSLPTYNSALQGLLMDAGITRKVQAYQGKKMVMLPLCRCASSHMGRRTFVGRLINRGVSAEVIKPMSGHTADSRAFSRYYAITDQQKAAAVEKI